HLSSTSLFLLLSRPSPASPLFPYTTLFRSRASGHRLCSLLSKAASLPCQESSPVSGREAVRPAPPNGGSPSAAQVSPLLGPTPRSEEHTSELQSRENLVCRLLLEKKKIQ